MTDATLRTLERSTTNPLHDVPLFMARVRAEWWEPWVACQECEPSNGNRKLYRAVPRESCKHCDGTGTGTRQDRYELAAYLGHAGARELVPSGWKDCRECDGTGNEYGYCSDPSCCDVDHDEPCPGCEGAKRVWIEAESLASWLRGLECWRPDRVFWAAGACAAGRVALEVAPAKPLSVVQGFADPRYRALEAAEAWVACPCEEHELACEGFLNSLEDNPGPWFGLLYAIVHWRGGTNGAAPASARQSITRSSILATEPTVRDAMRTTWLHLVLP